jgi:hypothetical protein
MMSTHPTVSGVARVEGLIEDTLAYMRGQGYSTLYLRLCRGVWRAFREFLGPDSSEGFSTDDINRYLESRGIRAASLGLSDRQRLIRAVMRILAEFSLHGCYQRRRCQSQKMKLSTSFQAALDRCESFCRNDRRYRPGTLRCRLRHITRCLHFWESVGLCEQASHCPRRISDFVCSQVHLSPKSLAHIVSDLRSFLRFLGGDGTTADERTVRVIFQKRAHNPCSWQRALTKSMSESPGG